MEKVISREIEKRHVKFQNLSLLKRSRLKVTESGEGGLEIGHS